MNESEPQGSSAQRERENADPGEGIRPLPWFMMMLLGAMAMWGAFYISTTPSGGDSSYGDQRTLAALSPPEQAAGTVAKVDGKQIFGSKCAACHQATGQGIPGVFPPLAASEWVLGEEKVLVNILLHGVVADIEVKGNHYQGAMPAWKDMSDAELAAVMSYIRSDWGNKAPEVESATVKAQRDATRLRTEPYKSAQDLRG